MSPHIANAQQGLQVTYGSKGVQQISYQGSVLEDVGANPSDAFHIWHIKTTDMNGNQLTSGQYGWGESNNGTNWNPQTNTETYYFSWGSIATQFVQNGNNLDMIVTETNNAGSGAILDGAEIYPFMLHFPTDPANFYGYTQYAITTTGPGVSVADYGSGVVTSVIPNESVAMYGGWKSAGNATYSPMMTTTYPDGIATFLPHNDRAVQPGSTLSYTVSLRFTPEGTAADASDAYASFAATYPSQMTWGDKRIIGTAYLASSPSLADQTQPGGYPTNPRRYFNDASVDITNAAGLQSFQGRMLAQAQANVTTANSMGAQGVITWDIEGEQYPMNTSYVCSPDQIATISPEMESIVTDSSSPYVGMKLDDAYFKTMTGAGLKVGVCLRPQVFTFGVNGTASQVYLSSNSAIIANLENKARYANQRWGVTMFYVDSTVDVNGGTLDPAIFQQLITDLPSFLFIPEESTPRYYAYSAPFYSFLFHGDLGTPASTYKFYPNAFGANLVNDVDPTALANATPQLTQSVKNGDILMGHAEYQQQNDATLVSIYQSAHIASTPTRTTPAIQWSAPGAMTYGAALSGAQLNATANTPGTFAYSPAMGTVLSAGVTNVTATFSPTDTTNYTPATASVPVTVNKATPAIQWSAPAAITTGTALSSAQLDAQAGVPGTMTYSPAAGTVLASGTYTLQATFTPADGVDYNSQTATVSIIVNAAPVVTPAPAPAPAPTPTPTPAPAPIPAGTSIAVLSPTAGSRVSGKITVKGYVNFGPDAAGTYLMVDGREVGTQRVTGGPYVYPLDTRHLTNGRHSLQLWGHDTGNNTHISAAVSVTVAN